jgi:site-specific recombinase XerD
MVLKDLFRRATDLAQFRMPPLGHEMDRFCDWLRCKGFSRHGIRRRLWHALHFNQYLRRRGVKDCQDMETSLADRFIKEHLPHCRELRYTARHFCKAGYVRSFIDYLEERGLLAPSSQPSTPYQELLQEFLDYLTRECNLAETTIKRHQKHLTPFLEDLGDVPTERLRKLTPTQVLALSTKHTQHTGQTMRQEMQGTWKVFFRFCLQKGYLERNMEQAFPKIRTYRLSDVPRGISEEDALKTLESIDRTKPLGLRDFAIIQLFHTYGVRAGQLYSLKLEDILWRKNKIYFIGHKGGKERIEPLFDEVGESLLEYLLRGRPQAPHSEVFLTTRRPFQPLSSHGTISDIVGKRMDQAGVSRSKVSSHAFRHGLATRLLQQGQTIKTIADILGHRNINTTFIYTKVDVETLRQVSLEWPEVSP